MKYVDFVQLVAIKFRVTVSQVYRSIIREEPNKKSLLKCLMLSHTKERKTKMMIMTKSTLMFI